MNMLMHTIIQIGGTPASYSIRRYRETTTTTTNIKSIIMRLSTAITTIMGKKRGKNRKRKSIGILNVKRLILYDRYECKY